MESFFALVQTHVLDRRSSTTRDELRIAIVTWIERPTTTADAKPASAARPRSNTR